MRFGIVGAGPVGSILAAHLARAGQEVYLVDLRADLIEETLRRGLTLRGACELHMPITGGLTRVADLGALRPDYVLLALKTNQLRSVLQELEPVLAPETILVSTQNGLDPEDLIAETFGARRTMRCVINFAGSLDAPGQVTVTFFRPPNHLGCLCSEVACDHARELAELLTGAQLETRAESNIKRYAWEKTLLNAAMSPVSTVTGMTMRAVMDQPETRRIVETLLQEGILVATSLGFDFPPDFMASCMSYLSKGGPHKPSMRLDLEQQRPTEIDFMNGRISHYGAQLGLPTPVHDTFTRLVKAFEVIGQPSPQA